MFQGMVETSRLSPARKCSCANTTEKNESYPKVLAFMQLPFLSIGLAQEGFWMDFALLVYFSAFHFK